MIGLAYAILLLWVPATLFMFAVWQPRRAAVTALVLGYLFLPQASLTILGVIHVTKPAVISVGLLLGILLYDSGHLATFRVRALDAAMLAWCAVPFASSVSNALPSTQALSATALSVWAYGIPYLVGRLYCRTSNDLAYMVRAVALGGIAYLPLCWLEMRFSPQLHFLAYGFQQHEFDQVRRYDGWRPMVFLQHGLALALWMSVATLAAFGLWRDSLRARLLGLTHRAWAYVLLVTTILCRSLSAAVMMLVGLAALRLSSGLRTVTPVLVLACLAPTYLVARVGLDWDVSSVVTSLREFDGDRAGSLETRVKTDSELRARALERPWLGWGPWGAFREQLSIRATDSMWGIVLGRYGVLGTLALFLVLLGAPINALLRVRRTAADAMRRTAVVAASAILAVYGLDCMVNAMPCQVFVALAGALVAPPDASPHGRAHRRPLSSERRA